MSHPDHPIALVEETESIVWLTLNRPTAGNSLSFDLVTELRRIFAELATRSDIKVVVISGAGGRIFSAGPRFERIHRRT